MKKVLSILILFCLILCAFSSCKRPDGTPVAAASVPKEISEEFLKTAAEKAADKGFSAGIAGEKAQNGDLRIPEGLPFRALIEKGAYCEGMEEFIPYSYAGKWTRKKGKPIPESAEEYVYYFDSAEIGSLKRTSDKNADYWYTGVDCASYTAFMEAFGEDGWIVIGRPVGAREEHLAYFSGVSFSFISLNRAAGFTVTDFAIDEVLSGTALPGTIRIYENYLYGDYQKEGIALYSLGYRTYPLRNDSRYLLFIKKAEDLEGYEIFGKKGGLPLTDDYKNYDQEYLGHLAGYLNRVPEEYAEEFREPYEGYAGEQFYQREHLVNQTGRSVEEALAANADDLIVTLAQKYKIKILPYKSQVFEDAGLVYSAMASEGCAPDNKSAFQQP